MITIYYSNKFECLKTQLIKILSENKSSNIFSSEIILAEDVSVREWLYIELAKKFGIFGNIIFYSPFNFIWNIVCKSLWGILPKNTMSCAMISWSLMKIFRNINYDVNTTTNWSIIKRYLHTDTCFDEKKCLQFSEKMADLFVQYFLYHPDWLLQWKFGKHINGLDIYIQSWQAELWRLFLQEISQNNTFFCFFEYNIYEYINNILMKNNINVKKLPKCIFIYGVSSFPIILIEILKALGKYIDIYIFCINPCRFFLKKHLDYHNVINVIRSTSESTYNLKLGLLNFFSNQGAIFNQNSRKCNNEGNILLFSWSGFFQKTLYSLLQLGVFHEENIFFENIKNVFLLQILQNDILNNYSQKSYSMVDISKTMSDEFEVKKRILYSSDCSLSVHVCHSIQREIEVLFNNLLIMMSNDSSLLPNEIVVMAPNINDYVSAIQFVFNHASIYGRSLPFTICNSKIQNLNSVISSFFKLLKISYSRFTINEVLEFLEIPALATRFGIDEEGIKLLRTWILESGIRWGLDDEMFSKHIMSSVTNVQCTWKFGLNRIFLGYTINSTSGPWNKVLPYNISNNNSLSLYALIGQFNQFLMKLKFWKIQFEKSYTLKEWLFFFNDIIEDFYIQNFDSETESSLLLLKNYWHEIIDSGININYDQTVSVDVLSSKLYDKCNKKEKKSFFTGGIIFCNLSEGHSIPFKIVYLLGMGFDSYPNYNIPLNFNLIEYKEQMDGFESSFYYGRYLFLEALLSARKRFYISFIGYSINSNRKYHPSILINELFEYIVHHFFYLDKDTGNILPLTMDWIHNNLWHWHTRMPFELKNFITGSKDQSFYKEWLFLSDTINLNYSKFLYPLSKIFIKTISLDNLYSFYMHPIRSWFQKRLNLYIPERLEISSDEPFCVDLHVQYQICTNLIFYFLNKQNINTLYQHVIFSGMLPYGSFGDIFWIKQYNAMIKLSQAIDKYYSPIDQYNLKVFLSFKNFQLTGVLRLVQKNGLLRWKPRVLSMRDGLLLWLEHLVYCSMGGEGDSWMFGINSYWHFRPLLDTEAKEYLSFLIFGYCSGMNAPLLLFSHSGGLWIQHCFDVEKKVISLDTKCQNVARRKLIMSWKGNRYTYGEGSDPYIQRLIPNLNDEYIESIISVAKDYFLPVMSFNIDITLNN